MDISFLRRHKAGNIKTTPISESNNPPTVPTAKGYQNDSFSEPIINGKKPKTQHEIASMLGISRSYVSRIETKAIGKLAKELEE